MSLVVGDTSPLRALAKLGLLGILRDLYSEVIVPPAFAAELRDAPDGHASVDPDRLAFLRVCPATDLARVEQFRVDLDAGESEARALALEVGAELVLIDEARERASATAAGLRIVGVAGILLEAKAAGLIPELRPLLDRLRGEFNFFLSIELRDQALHLAGEADGDHR